jgi:hypothetical protein
VLHSLQEVAKSGFAVLQCGQFIIRDGRADGKLSDSAIIRQRGLVCNY